MEVRILRAALFGCEVAAANRSALSQQPKAAVTLPRANIRRINWMESIGASGPAAFGCGGD
jgi:hypothetical protein